MKKIIITLIFAIIFGVLLSAEALKIGVLQFKKSDKKSEYVTKMLMTKDFKDVLKNNKDCVSKSSIFG